MIIGINIKPKTVKLLEKKLHRTNLCDLELGEDVLDKTQKG